MRWFRRHRLSAGNREPATTPSGALGETDPRGLYVTFLVAVSLLHVGAVYRLINPAILFDDNVVLSADFPMHSHHADFFRRAVYAGDWGWGCDPHVNAATVFTPTQDAGGRMHEVASVLLPGVSAAAVVKLDLLLTALLVPVGVVLGGRLLGLTRGAKLASLVVFLLAFWLLPTFYGFLRWGMVDFTLAAAVTPICLGTFVRFVREPSWPRYVGFIGASSALFLAHVMGVVVVLAPLVAVTVFHRDIAARWRGRGVGGPPRTAGRQKWGVKPRAVGG
jgi:hypothetical protein